MNGDRNGSPNGAPGQSTPFSFGDGSEQGFGWDAPRTPNLSVPSTDVKVAGAPTSVTGTALLSPPRDEWAHEEIADADGFRPTDRAQRSLPGRFALPKVAVVAVAAAVVVGGGAVAVAAVFSGGSSDNSTNAVVVPSRPGTPEADPVSDAAAQQAAAAAMRKQVLNRASRAAHKDAGKRLALGLKGTPLPSATPSTGTSTSGGGGGDPVPASEAQRIAKAMLPSWGFGGSGQFGCLVNLWNRESHWNTHAGNASGAYGIPQALPGSKMASAGADWRDSAQTQIKWGLGYIKGRYGTPCGAWGHFQSSNWY